MTEDDEATVKRFFKEKNRYRLQPENSAMSPIYLDNVTVIGKVIGLYREL
ncbi:S24 family peptidase, partial [Staphylococcus hominis]|nr:S24 family peptidase [Staphylococcus hominis]